MTERVRQATAIAEKVIAYLHTLDGLNPCLRRAPEDHLRDLQRDVSAIISDALGVPAESDSPVVDRAGWAVTVLDAWAEMDDEIRPPYASRDRDPDGKGWVVCVHNYPNKSGRMIEFRIFEGATANEAREAAAVNLFPLLPASVRAELGDAPKAQPVPAEQEAASSVGEQG